MISKTDSHFLCPPKEAEMLINIITAKCVISYKLYY